MYSPYMNFLIVDMRLLSDKVFAECKTDDEIQTTAGPLLSLDENSNSPEANQLLQNMTGFHKSELLPAIRDQAETRCRYQEAITEHDIEIALEAYEAIFSELSDNYLVHGLKTMIAIELSHLFGPDSPWVMVINEDDQLDAIQSSQVKGENLQNGFIIGDGFRLVFNQTDGIWTDGDMEFQTVYGKPGIFGWPVDVYGSPLSGYLGLFEK